MQFTAMNCACMSVGKAGYSLVRKLTAFGRPLHADAQPAVDGVDLCAGLAQLVDHRVEVVGARALEQHLAAGRRHRAQEGAGLDAVGDDAVRRARRVQTLAHPGCGCGCVPWPSICAPMPISISARSWISGS